jgi:beta-lactamase class A
MVDIRTQVEQLAQACGGDVSVCVRKISNAFDLAFNEDLRVRSASTIKVPIIVEAMRQVHAGTLDLQTEYTFTPDRRCSGSGVITHLREGAVLSLKDILTLMIIVSDNTATNAAIDIVGIDNVNAMLRGFGCTGTTLMRKMYDWEGIAAGRDNFAVAREMADLLVRIARREAVGGGYDEMIHGIMKGQLYSDELGLLLPEGVLANKTGQVDGVVNDCGIVTTDSFCYTIAVFVKDPPCPGEAKVGIGRISKAIFDAVVA